MSPDFSSTHLISRLCKSKIRVSNGFRIQLNFSEIDVEPHQSCSYNSLSIYNGPDEAAPLFGRYCDRYTATTLTSSSNEILITFKSNLWGIRKGFKATYNSISGGRNFHLTHITIIEKLQVAIIFNE